MEMQWYVLLIFLKYIKVNNKIIGACIEYLKS